MKQIGIKSDHLKKFNLPSDINSFLNKFPIMYQRMSSSFEGQVRVTVLPLIVDMRLTNLCELAETANRLNKFIIICCVLMRTILISKLNSDFQLSDHKKRKA